MSALFWLAIGAVLGALFASYARSKRVRANRVFGIGLFVAGLIYVAFVTRSPEWQFWAAVESAGLVFFGILGIAGVEGNAWWLVAGWGLHPLWDVGLHYLGAGVHFVPEWYSVGCVSFDLVVASYVVRSKALSYGQEPLPD